MEVNTRAFLGLGGPVGQQSGSLSSVRELTSVRWRVTEEDPVPLGVMGLHMCMCTHTLGNKQLAIVTCGVFEQW